VKIRGGIGEISIPIVEALPIYDRTYKINLVAVHCVAAERGGLIKRKRKKLENVAIANALQLEAAEPRPLPLYLRSYDAMPSLTSLNIHCLFCC